MKTNKGIIALSVIGGLIATLVILYFPAYLWFFPYLHDNTLARFSQQLVGVSLPEQTREIDRLSVVGQQSGNSDHCDYLSGVMLQTALPKAELEQYYRANYVGRSEVRFLWLDENSNDVGIYTLMDWIRDNNKSDDANVVIYIFEGSMTSSIDYRCS